MSEEYDYKPDPRWKGHDFKSVRAAYSASVDRSMAVAVDAGIGAKDLVQPRIRVTCKRPLFLGLDVTGSMGEWPGVIVSKFPYLDHECRTEYCGEDYKVVFMFIGDEYADDHYPLQVLPPSSGPDIQELLEIKNKHYVIEKGGGGQIMESYGLCLAYLAGNVDLEPDAKPILIMTGDEKAHPVISKRALDMYNIPSNGTLTTEGLVETLSKTFSIYMIVKPYSGVASEPMVGKDKDIYDYWVELLGEDHVAILPNPDRTVDVIFGILAKEADKVDYFAGEIEKRQEKDEGGDKKIAEAMKALRTIHGPMDLSGSVGKKQSSRLLISAGGVKTKSLLSK